MHEATGNSRSACLHFPAKLGFKKGNGLFSHSLPLVKNLKGLFPMGYDLAETALSLCMGSCEMLSSGQSVVHCFLLDSTFLMAPAWEKKSSCLLQWGNSGNGLGIVLRTTI